METAMLLAFGLLWAGYGAYTVKRESRFRWMTPEEAFILVALGPMPDLWSCVDDFLERLHDRQREDR